MASKTESTKAAASKDKPEDAEPKTTSDGADETPAEAPADAVVSDCVVNGGKGMHVGRAVNGKVCSYHAMHYDPDGNKR